ncbi:MAG: hypothetical protein HYX64_10530 [Gammaproteobacteria bacterium]|nr:hypothetical protein [Gammaproteobacteria bacterium]
MKKLLLLFAGAALLAASGLRAEATPAAAAPFLGTWRCAETTMQFTVGLVNGVISFQAVDTADGEKFEIKNVQLKDGVLSVTQRMPSTNRTTQAKYRSTGKDTLEERSTGDWEGTLLWHRKN